MKLISSLEYENYVLSIYSDGFGLFVGECKLICLYVKSNNILNLKTIFTKRVDTVLELNIPKGNLLSWLEEEGYELIIKRKEGGGICSQIGIGVNLNFTYESKSTFDILDAFRTRVEVEKMSEQELHNYNGYLLTIKPLTIEHSLSGFIRIASFGDTIFRRFVGDTAKEVKEKFVSYIDKNQMNNLAEDKDKKIAEYKELEETFLAIRKEVNNAESQFDMYCYATSTWPEFVEELLRIIKEKINE